MLVDILAYRGWAIDIANSVRNNLYLKHEIHIHTSLENCHKDASLTFLLGWSDIVPLEFYKDKTVLVLHPSPLPRYRGGSPIQHQIMAGETESAVTLFFLNTDFPYVDSGPIYRQCPFSLEGDLSDILSRITEIGIELVTAAIEDSNENGIYMRFRKQDETMATTFKRRRPEQSEITVEDLQALTAKQLYDKIRALQDPYPNAFITCNDGSKLYITKAHL